MNIYPSTTIAEKFNTEVLNNKPSLQELIADIGVYLKTVEKENLKFLHAEENQNINSNETLKFFRSQERIRNWRLILQYLVTFLSKIPLKEDFEEKVVNPFKQLKSFTRFYLNLLKQSDVIEAILREHKELGLLTETNIWYYKGQINKNYIQILEVLESAESAVIEDYCEIFETLQRLCLFWFSVRNEDIKRIRNSDIYVYKLTYILLNRHRAPGSETVQD